MIGTEDRVFIRKRLWRERIVRAATFLCALISIGTTFGIIYVLVSESVQFFAKVSPIEFFTGTEWAPRFAPPKFGVLPLLNGTLLVAVGAGAVAIPLGLLAGIYLSEYAKPRVRNALKPILEVLAGIPTVVYGYFAITFITPLLQQRIPDLPIFNALSAAIVVGIMTLPIVASLSEDALSAVPRELREGGMAMGATKGEVIRKIVIPGALSGVMSAFLLAFSRAVGETMAVTLAAGADPKMTLSFLTSIQTMSAYIVQASLGDTPHGTVEYQTIFAVGLTLFVITLIMNLLAAWLVKRYRQRYA
ncbi:MAG: phosphate ABC transporter permease subunit PstC [Armatimonadetes bacterium]|nr:MAG: phosphate ABC transporter permease subunit PstC [Armatimonadota bacterium]